MIIINTQGIVLRSVRYKENDVILTIFTRKLGKVSAIAKGAKRNKSFLLSASQVFSYSNFTLKKQGNMYRVSQSETIKNFYDIAYDIESFTYATYITSLVDGSIYENQTNNRLFVLLAQALYLYTQKNLDKEYIFIVSGAIPIKDDGLYTTIAPHKGRKITAKEAVSVISKNAKYIINVGTCACFGGPTAARPNLSGAVSVSEFLNRNDIIKIPGCPVNPVWVAGILGYITSE